MVFLFVVLGVEQVERHFGEHLDVVLVALNLLRSEKRDENLPEPPEECEFSELCIFAVLDGPMAHTRYKLLAPGSNLFLFTSPRDLLYVKQM